MATTRSRTPWHERCLATGMVTLDAHHDVRDGMSNGSPVARLVESGMDGRPLCRSGSRISPTPASTPPGRDYGITIIGRDEVAGRGMVSVMEQALQIAGRGEGPRVHVDLDVDVRDRAVAPACPASVPGV